VVREPRAAGRRERVGALRAGGAAAARGRGGARRPGAGERGGARERRCARGRGRRVVARHAAGHRLRAAGFHRRREAAVMRARLSARDRRALELGAAVVMPVLVWMFAGVPDVRALGEARARLEAERDLLARELELVASAPAHLADAERATQGLLNAAPRLFAAAND